MRDIPGCSTPLARSASPTIYNPHMSLTEQIQKDIVTAMKAKDEARLSCLRMVKSALMNRKVEKMAELDDKECQAVLATLIKQRKESVEQFTKGGRQEMADKEAAEIGRDREPTFPKPPQKPTSLPA